MSARSPKEVQTRMVLNVDSLAKRYGEQAALADITFAVRASEIVGIIGPNGAGKTTLLEGLAGILPMDSATFAGAESRCLLRAGAKRYSMSQTGCDLIGIKVLIGFLHSLRMSTEDRWTRSSTRSNQRVWLRLSASACNRCRKATTEDSCWRWDYSRRMRCSLWMSRLTASTFGKLATLPTCCAGRRRPAEHWPLRYINWRMQSVFVIASSSWPMVAFEAPAPSTICKCRPGLQREVWRTSSLRSHEMFRVQDAPLRPLLVKQLWEIVSGRALWTMLLLVCPLIGYSFFQAMSLYGEASATAQQSQVLARTLSPLDGVLVPTLGASYLAVTLLFPFVAIRVLGQEKESGALRLLVQLPYRSATLVGAKLAAVLAAWTLANIPAFSMLVIWSMSGGHLSAPETWNLFFGHLLYGLLVGAIALFSASVSESAATAAIVTLAFTIGSWVLDFTVAGRPGLLEWIAALSLTQVLRTFEQGLLSVGLVLGTVAVLSGFAALATVWLPPGVPTRLKVMRSAVCICATAIVLGLASQIAVSIDVTEDRRNSFPVSDQRVLAKLGEPLVVTVHLAPEDPRYADLQRNVLAKLERVLPRMTVRLAGGNPSIVTYADDDFYGEVEYSYGSRTDISRSTSPREILPLLYGLANISPPALAPGSDYPGYPLIARRWFPLLWFFGGLPLLIIFAWWWSCRPSRSLALVSQGRSRHEFR